MILVFGGGGQLGQELSREAAAQRVPLVAVHRTEADITSAEQVRSALARYRPALVINAAAYTNVDEAEDQSAQAFAVNADGAANVASACGLSGTPLIHMSTDYVFDGTKTGAYREDDEVHPLGVYGRSKAAGENAVRVLAPQHIILRTAWVYGEFGRNFAKTILRLARERDELRVVNDQRGNPTSTGQLARAIIALAPSLSHTEGPWDTYHFAGSGKTSWYGFAEHLVALQCRLTGRRPRVTPISTDQYPTRARRPANSALDCSKFIATFRRSPEHWTDESAAVCRRLIQSAEAA